MSKHVLNCLKGVQLLRFFLAIAPAKNASLRKVIFVHCLTNLQVASQTLLVVHPCPLGYDKEVKLQSLALSEAQDHLKSSRISTPNQDGKHCENPEIDQLRISVNFKYVR